MKVLCPRCKKTIDLGYLEKKGDQMMSCPNCNMSIAATYKKDGVRHSWEIFFETSTPKKDPRDERGGCGTAMVVLIILAILIAMSQCEWKVPFKLPSELPLDQFRK